MRRLLRWMRHEEGATAVEYAVMLTLIIAACIAAFRLLTNATGGSLIHSSDQIDTYFNGS